MVLETRVTHCVRLLSLVVVAVIPLPLQNPLDS